MQPKINFKTKSPDRKVMSAGNNFFGNCIF